MTDDWRERARKFPSGHPNRTFLDFELIDEIIEQSERKPMPEETKQGPRLEDVALLGDRILARRKEAVKFYGGDEKTGIAVPETHQQAPNEAVVIVTGPGRMLENGGLAPMRCKPGNVVLFGKHGGTDIKLLGEEVIILREDEVLAILPEPKDAIDKLLDVIADRRVEQIEAIKEDRRG